MATVVPTLETDPPKSIAQVVQDHAAAVVSTYMDDSMRAIAEALGVSRNHLYRLIGGWRRKGKDGK